MYKGKRKVLMKVLSLALAAGMSISGLPVSALAAETAAPALQEEALRLSPLRSFLRAPSPWRPNYSGDEGRMQ